MKTPIASDLDGELTVNEIIARFPETVAIFNRHHIDACCGGSVSLREAALRDGVDPSVLIEEVRGVVEGRK